MVLTQGRTCWLSFMAEDVDVHGGEYVGVDLPPVISCVLIAGVHRMCRPVGPEESSLKQCQRKGVRQLTSDNHLPKEANKHNNPIQLDLIQLCKFTLPHCMVYIALNQQPTQCSGESAYSITKR